MEANTTCTVTLTVREWLDISQMLIKSVLDIRMELEKSKDDKYKDHVIGIGTDIANTLDKIVVALEVEKRRG